MKDMSLFMRLYRLTPLAKELQVYNVFFRRANLISTRGGDYPDLRDITYNIKRCYLPLSKAVFRASQ